VTSRNSGTCISIKKVGKILFLDGTWSFYSNQFDPDSAHAFEEYLMECFDHFLQSFVLIGFEDVLAYMKSF